MKSTTYFPMFLALICGLILSVNTACTRQQPALNGRVTFVLGEVTLNNKPCAFGDLVSAKDEIATKADSLAVIQFGDSAILNLKENTTLSVGNLATDKGTDSIMVNLESGSTFNKIVKKGTDYSVATTTAIAGVRGTTFTMSTDGSAAEIKLSTGAVHVTPVVDGTPAPAKAMDLAAGNKVEVTTETIEKPVALDETEKKELQSLEKIALIPNIADQQKIEELRSIKPEEKPVVVPEETVKTILETATTEEKKEDKPAPKPLTLKDIQQKFGTVSVVTTKDGRTYTGAFSQEGATVRVYTISGTVEIPSENLAGVDRYNGEL